MNPNCPTVSLVIGSLEVLAAEGSPEIVNRPVAVHPTYSNDALELGEVSSRDHQVTAVTHSLGTLPAYSALKQLAQRFPPHSEHLRKSMRAMCLAPKCPCPAAFRHRQVRRRRGLTLRRWLFHATKQSNVAPASLTLFCS
ncbi:hypothetical protein PG995_007641 [Apiospora arundinis]